MTTLMMEARIEWDSATSMTSATGAHEIPTALEMRCARRAVREGRTASPTPSTCVIQPLPRRATCLSASTADAMPRNKQ